MELAGTEAVQMAPGQVCQHMGQYNTGLPTLGIPTHSSRIREHKRRKYLFDFRFFTAIVVYKLFGYICPVLC